MTNFPRNDTGAEQRHELTTAVDQPTPDELRWWLRQPRNEDAELLTTLETNYYKSQQANAEAHLAEAARYYQAHPEALTPQVRALIRALLYVSETKGEGEHG